MPDKVVYLVCEHFDNCKEYECRDWTDEVIAVCDTREIAERIIEERCDEILNREYEPYIDYNFRTRESKEHIIVAKKRIHGDNWWDIFVGAQDGTDVYEPYVGVYEYKITERILNKRSS